MQYAQLAGVSCGRGTGRLFEGGTGVVAHAARPVSDPCGGSNRNSACGFSSADHAASRPTELGPAALKRHAADARLRARSAAVARFGERSRIQHAVARRRTRRPRHQADRRVSQAHPGIVVTLSIANAAVCMQRVLSSAGRRRRDRGAPGPQPARIARAAARPAGRDGAGGQPGREEAQAEVRATRAGSR